MKQIIIDAELRSAYNTGMCNKKEFLYELDRLFVGLNLNVLTPTFTCGLLCGGIFK